jgi:Ca2+-binding RTX toxin-like protein
MVTFVEWGGSGAAGIDTIFAGFGSPPLGAVNGITLSLTSPIFNTNLADGLTLTSVERVTGSSYQAIFFGDGNSNDFRGIGGYDWFVGSAGGRERYFGGDGLDTVTYFTSGEGVIASLRNGASEFGGQPSGYGVGGDAALDLYFEIENLVGSQYDDRLEGNDLRNQLSGLDGDDYLLGCGGTDYLKGAEGNDTLDGGAGSAFAIFSGDRFGYTLTRTSSNEGSVLGAGGSDSLINVEYFQFNDVTVSIFELDIV